MAEEFEPTENQEKVLRLFQDHDYSITVTGACEQAGISRAAYYQWFNRPEFCEWWEQAAERHFAMRLPAVYAAVYDAATKGAQGKDMAAAKLFIQRFDAKFLPKTQQEQIGNTPIILKWAEPQNSGDAEMRAAMADIPNGDKL